jgi:hypothetical protein
MLNNGAGWTYNRIIPVAFLGIPVENILFIYPVSPALTMIFYSIITRSLNDLKAFWLLNLILLPCSIGFELIAIYLLDVWTVLNEGSIWPMGRTNFEEFFFYILFQFFSIALYVFFKRRLRVEDLA